jgi:hypothetical protein
MRNVTAVVRGRQEVSKGLVCRFRTNKISKCWCAGSGRDSFKFASSIEEALMMGGFCFLFLHVQPRYVDTHQLVSVAL